MIAADLRRNRLPGSYHWQPIPNGGPGRGDRHVFLGAKEDYRTGQPAPTLCGLRVDYTDQGDWLWPTCRRCYAAAKELNRSVAR